MSMSDAAALDPLPDEPYQVSMISGDELAATCGNGVRLGLLYATRATVVSSDRIAEIVRGELAPEAVGLAWTPPKKPVVRGLALVALRLSRWLERRGW